MRRARRHGSSRRDAPEPGTGSDENDARLSPSSSTLPDVTITLRNTTPRPWTGTWGSAHNRPHEPDLSPDDRPMRWRLQWVLAASPAVALGSVLIWSSAPVRSAAITACGLAGAASLTG